MKKFAKGLLALVAAVMVVGCSKPVKLDFEKVVENVSEVTYVCEAGNEECPLETGDPIFGMMMPVDDEMLVSLFQINPENFEEYLFQYPMMIVHSSMYFIGKPAEGKEEVAKSEVDAFIARWEEQWSTYLPAQYELVQNRLETTVGDYLVYIISYNNEAVLEAIKASEAVTE